MEKTEILTIERLKKFAKDNTLNQMTVYGKSYNTYLITKTSNNKGIISIYTSNMMSRRDDDFLKLRFENLGFYNTKDDNLYSLEFCLLYSAFGITSEEIRENSLSTCNLQSNILSMVLDKACSKIGDSFRYVKLSRENAEDLITYKKFFLEDEIKDSFFAGKENISFVEYITTRNNAFTNKIDVDSDISLTDCMLLVTDDEKEKFALQKAEKYVKEYKEELSLIMKKVDLLNSGIKAIYDDKNHIYHKRKAIREAVKEKKTVNVTILKEGKTLTFKTSTETLARGGYHNSYSPYDIQASDRKKYSELFGFTYNDYNADNVLKITYGKKEIYVKD